MKNKRLLVIFQDQKFIFVLVLITFFLKGIVFSVLIPFFQNPDEQIHYGTVQHWAEPDQKTWEIKGHDTQTYSIDPEDIRTYILPQETSESAARIGFDEIKFQNQNTQDFSDTSTEDTIRSNHWKRYVDTYPANTSGTRSFYYLVASWIERGLAGYDIFTRMFAIRFFSVLLGLAVVYSAYFVFLKIGFSRFESLIVASMASFQPMLGAAASQINIDIALVASFALFTYAAVSLIRTSDLRFFILSLIAALLGFFAKGPGIVLIASLIPLLSYAIWIRFGQKIKERISLLNTPQKTLWISLVFLIVFIGTVLWNIIPASYIASITHASAPSKFDSPLTSLSAYLNKTIDIDAFRWSAVSYWGNFGWLDTRIGDSIFNAIWTIEIIGLIGILLYLVPWHPKKFPLLFTGTRDFLPEKKYLLFLLLLSLALQGAIRFYDWRVFDATTKILIGTPGRYFLPNIIAHFTLLVTGLGFFCRSRVQFQWLLKSLLVGIVLLNFYALFTVILPRYYL